MAESVKELSSGTLTQANLASDGTLPVFTNNSSTTKVVRDVHVGTSTVTSTQARLSVDGIPASETLESSTGTVVVPPSNSLDIEFNPTLVQPTKKSLNFYQLDYVDSNEVNIYPITGIEQEGTSDTRFTYNFAGASLGTTPSIGSAVDLVPPFHSQGPYGGQSLAQFVKVPAETSYYYWYKDSNSTSQFRRLNYGSDETAQGTQTTIFSTSYHGPALDFKRMKYYGSEGGNIREYDLTKAGGLDSTSSSYTQYTGYQSGNSSYFSADAVNNVYFGSQSSETWIRNLALSAGNARINNNAYNTSHRRTIALYNSSEDRYYLLVGAQGFSTGNTHFSYFEASQIATNVTSNYSVNETDVLNGSFSSYLNSLTGGNSYDSMIHYLSRLDDNVLAIPYSSTKWRLWKAEGGNLVYLNIEIDGTQALDSTYYNTLVPYGEINQTQTNLPYTAYTGISTKLRTQGVEIT
jgi:hypothetical protein